jgi:hypothetical protein
MPLTPDRRCSDTFCNGGPTTTIDMAHMEYVYAVFKYIHIVFCV